MIMKPTRAVTFFLLCLSLCACASHEQQFERFIKEGKAAYEKPNFALAAQSFQAASREGAFLPKNDPRPIQALRGEAASLAGQNKTDEAIAKLESAQSMAQARKLAREEALVLEELAIQHMKLKEQDTAVEELKKALDILEQQDLDETIDGARILTALGGAFNSAGQFDKAVQVLGQARDIYEAKAPEDGNSLAITLHFLAHAYRMKNEEDMAIELDEKAKRCELQAIDATVDKLKMKW